MSSVRRLVYATLLVLITLNFAPSPASAQEPASGHFALTHDVRWGNAKVPAGEYRFSFDAGGVGGVLTLTRMSSPRHGYILMVREVEDTKPSDQSRLVLMQSPDGSYVSTMQLPDFGVTLHFASPPVTPEKAIVRTLATSRPGQ